MTHRKVVVEENSLLHTVQPPPECNEANLRTSPGVYVYIYYFRKDQGGISLRLNLLPVSLMPVDKYTCRGGRVLRAIATGGEREVFPEPCRYVQLNGCRTIRHHLHGQNNDGSQRGPLSVGNLPVIPLLNDENGRPSWAAVSSNSHIFTHSAKYAHQRNLRRGTQMIMSFWADGVKRLAKERSNHGFSIGLISATKTMYHYPITYTTRGWEQSHPVGFRQSL